MHDEQLAEHGGLAGVRDPNLLASALARPENQAAYGQPDVANLAAASPEVRRIFAKDQAGAEMARKLGISPDWAFAIIKSVGNYGEVFEQNLGKGSPLNMNRANSPNRLVRDGGLLYAHPIR